MADVFFADWELWQQMSFCLACLICIVFIIGIFRLHYLNWKSKRIMLEDEEKRSRLSEVRRTGLRVRRDNDIPFGVRAIEGGIEVDGIWISRPTTPATPNDKRFASLTTLATDEAQGKGKDVDSSGSDLIDTATPSGSPRLSSNDYYRPKQPSQLRNVGDGDVATRNSDGQGRVVDTYIPQQQPQRRPGPPSQRTSGSSEHEQSHSPVFQTPQYQQKPARDYSPSSRTNNRTPDPFGSGSRTNSLSGYPTMDYTDNTGMLQPARTFVPGQQMRR